MKMIRSSVWLPVVVGALGYFVDIYDLVLFSIVRVPSLKALGVPEADLLDIGVLLLNCQMAGLLIGGVIWGVVGDKKGRLSVLFGSILLYSVANIANGFVSSVELYAILRLIAGVGLAGELGAAITLVSEILPKEVRGYGTAVVAGVGLSGAVVAGLVGDLIAWNWAYIIGGCLGLVLLVMRLGVLESHLFVEAKQKEIKRGDLKMLLCSKERLLKYLCCIAVGIPIWYAVGILVTFSPEIAKELKILVPVNAGQSILYCYAGVALGDLLTGFISQFVKSRRKVVVFCILGVAAMMATILYTPEATAELFYRSCFILGLFTGYWAVFVTIAAEQFGTNLRSTVTTSVPNFVRGSVVPMTLAFQTLSSSRYSLVQSASIVGTVAIILSLIGIFSLSESYGRDLNFLEVE